MKVVKVVKAGGEKSVNRRMRLRTIRRTGMMEGLHNCATTALIMQPLW